MTTIERLEALLLRDLQLPSKAVHAEVRLEDLQVDSLRLLEILFSVEDEFNITVAANQAELKERLQTVGDLALFIEALVDEQQQKTLAREETREEAAP